MRHPSYPIGVFKFKVAFLKDLRGPCPLNPLISPFPVTHVLPSHSTVRYSPQVGSRQRASDSSRILARTALAASIPSLPVSHSVRKSRNFLLWMEPNRMGRKKRGNEEERRTPNFRFFFFLFAASHVKIIIGLVYFLMCVRWAHFGNCVVPL